MNFAELAEHLRRRAQVAIEPHWAAYQSVDPNPTLDAFLRYLKDERVISPDVFASLHTSGRIDMTELAPSLAYRATQGAIDRTSARPPPEAAAASGLEATQTHELLGELGRGAMGAVHLARDFVLRRKVAMKSILPEMQQNAQLLSRFLGEMQITAQLDHPFIVPIYGVEDGPGGGLAYTMKVVHGRELAELIEETSAATKTGKPLPPELALEARLEIFLKVCDAVAYANERGVVHRDLKPANVMLGPFNVVYVMDWGIARLMGAAGHRNDQAVEMYDADGADVRQTTRTRVGSTIGTPIYMSPEQAEGRNDELDGRSDLYTLGLILQEVVTLERAIGGNTMEEVLTNAKQGRRVALPASSAGKSAPVELQAIIERATRLKPADRYPSVTAFADDIRRYLRNEAISAKPDTTTQRMGRWVSKNRIATLVLLLTTLTVGAAGTIGLLLYNRSIVARKHNRELRLAELQASSALRAQELDRTLQRYETLLGRLAGATRLAMSRQAGGEVALRFAESFQAGSEGIVDSKYYGKPVSLDWPVAALAPGTARDPFTTDANTATSLRTLARETMLASYRPAFYGMSGSDRQRVLVDTGVPVARIELTTATGLTLSYPGMAGLAPDTDARKAPKFARAILSAQPVWGIPGETNGAAMTLPCSTALRDDAGNILGVLSFDVDLAQATATAIGEPDTQIETSMLVDRAGKVLAEQTPTDGSPKSGSLDMPAVSAALERGESGTIETERKGHPVVVTLQPLATLDWYLVTASRVTAVESGKAPSGASSGRVAARTAPSGAPELPSSAPPAPAPAPTPEASTSAAPSASAAPSTAPTLGGPMPTAPATAPTAPAPPVEPDPFDPWDKYKKGKKP